MNMTFKTSINCSGCEAKVRPALNELVGQEGWKVDTSHPDKLLTISHASAEEAEIVQALNSLGFKIERKG